MGLIIKPLYVIGIIEMANKILFTAVMPANLIPANVLIKRMVEHLYCAVCSLCCALNGVSKNN